MDLHILIVISCVFLASLCSLLFINKFFRRKTFEEIIAEKKANEKIYQNKVALASGNGASGAAVNRKPKKQLQQLKKEQKREKKQRQKEQQQRDSNTTEQEDSDAHSEEQALTQEEQPTLAGFASKSHVEFEPDPEVLTFNSDSATANARSGSEKEPQSSNVGSTNSKPKAKKEKKNAKTAAAAGILLNKHEPSVILEAPAVAETLNHFEARQPKDVVELKKAEKKEEVKVNGASKKSNKKEKLVALTEGQLSAATVADVAVEAKEPKPQPDEKATARHASPKQQQIAVGNHHNNKSNNKSKRQMKDSAATRELVLALDKLSESDTIGVSLLMNLCRRAELNRSEIQMLIDYLLNRQQDMPASHAEWSDDLCQKLRRQLEEKERLLAEEQEASGGIQAKLRELRTEINTERAQMNAITKAYTEKLQLKDQEISGLQQELQAVGDKLALERQQLQSKLQLAKQSGSQDLLAQLQLMQQELAHKDKCVAELTHMVSATQQSSELLQTQAQQLRALEQQRDELEATANQRIYELEQARTAEVELVERRLELRNMQNALETARADATQARQDADAGRAEMARLRGVELGEQQQAVQSLQAQNEKLAAQLVGVSGQAEVQSQQQSAVQATLHAVERQLAERERQLADLQAELATTAAQLPSQQQLADTLRAEIAAKDQQLQAAAANLSGRERELLQHLQEQKEKNNDLRMKNWKLVEALQSAETTTKATANVKYQPSANASLVQEQQLLLAATQKTNNDGGAKDEQQLRALFQRLYPEAVRACASNALSLTCEQWLEQVLAAHVAQSLSKTQTASSSHKSTQLSNSNSVVANSNHNSDSAHNNNSYSDNDLLLQHEATPTTVHSNIRISNNSSSNSGEDGPSPTADMQKLHTQNAQLRAQIDELTKLVTKTSNTLSELEGRAREQDEYWRGVVRSKDEQIVALKQHSNGEQQAI